VRLAVTPDPRLQACAMHERPAGHSALVAQSCATPDVVVAVPEQAVVHDVDAIKVCVLPTPQQTCPPEQSEALRQENGTVSAGQV
jgi:hypothetical protein